MGNTMSKHTFDGTNEALAYFNPMLNTNYAQTIQLLGKERANKVVEKAYNELMRREMLGKETVKERLRKKLEDRKKKQLEDNKP